ncbi:MAG: ABC-F family ATP-binding cassette domain-containing protein [Isosphaeraceae bacterium]
MAVLIQIRDAHKSYGGQALLAGAEASITDDVKVGFVGRNGAGKSTLLKILLGEEELDRGEVIQHPRLRLGYLRQHDAFLPGETVIDFLMRDSGQPDWRCGEVGAQFELKGAYLDGPIDKMSGGWQTRVKLAALLLHSPNLLLLDEPTNFLDLRTQILLEHFLRNYDKACLIVSHDRAFLGATCDHTLDLSRGKLTMYPGKIDAYTENQKERRKQDERVNAGVLAKKKHLQEFIDKNKARASTATRAKSKEKQLEKLETIEIAAEEPRVSIRAPLVEPRRGSALRCIDVAMGYPERQIASGIGVEVVHGSRTAIVGDNGQGKTTFLRTIVDSLKPLEGEVRWGHGCNIGIYAQHVYTSLPQNQTVMEYLENTAPGGTKTQELLNGAASLLFRGSDVKKKVAYLSGGERARLCLAGLMLGQYNVLILDEPGNHLDVESVDSLAEALLAYKGTVIFTSHDRYFLKRMATSIIEVRDGRVVNYHGDYEAYLYAVNKEIEEGERETALRMSRAPAELLKVKAANKAARRNERDVRKEIGTIEKTIARLDDQKKITHTQLLSATDPKEALRLHIEVEDLAKQLNEAEERWCALQEELGELD